MESKNRGMEDLGVKYGSKTQALWERVKKESMVLIEQSKDNLKIQQGMLDMAERKILEELEIQREKRKV